MTRAIFIRELSENINWKQRQTPDLAILYRIYSESGTKIPLCDWFDVRLMSLSRKNWERRQFFKNLRQMSTKKTKFLKIGGKSPPLGTPLFI
jgi:hypothetical protein